MSKLPSQDLPLLVNTHVDDLRDSFPVHIMLEKTGDGSRVAVR